MPQERLTVVYSHIKINDRGVTRSLPPIHKRDFDLTTTETEGLVVQKNRFEILKQIELWLKDVVGPLSGVKE